MLQQGGLGVHCRLNGLVCKMWVRGKDKNNPGKFEYSLYDDQRLVECVGGFDTHFEADRAAERAERKLWASAVRFDELDDIPDSIAKMSDDELLAELLTDD
jgi:hypothetical protein